MTRAEYRIACIHYQRINQVLDTSEFMILGLVLFYGVELAAETIYPGEDVIMAAMTHTLPSVPMPFHGVLLVVTALLHLLMIMANNLGRRKWFIALEGLFFVYVGWSLALRAQWGFDFIAACCCTLFCLLNYTTMLKPKHSQASEKAESAASHADEHYT